MINNNFGAQNITKLFSSKYNELIPKNSKENLNNEKICKIFNQIRNDLKKQNFELNDGITKIQNEYEKINPVKKIFFKIKSLLGFKSEIQKAKEILKIVDINEISEIVNKSNDIYECIGKSKGPDGGYIYEFTIKNNFVDFDIPSDAPEMNTEESPVEEDEEEGENYARADVLRDQDHAREAGRKIINKQFPAVYPLGSTVIQLLPESQMENQDDRKEFYKKLGYKLEFKDNQLHFFLPDKESLTNSYNKLRETDKNRWPKISIADSEGIASDEDYISAILKHDSLLSKEKEFIHDQFFHIYVLLGNIYDSTTAEEYTTERDRLREVIVRDKTLIEEHKAQLTENEFQLAMCILGSVADGFNARSFVFANNRRKEEDQKTFQNRLNEPYKNDMWGNYFNSRFLKMENLSEKIYQNLFNEEK